MLWVGEIRQCWLCADVGWEDFPSCVSLAFFLSNTPCEFSSACLAHTFLSDKFWCKNNLMCLETLQTNPSVLTWRLWLLYYHISFPDNAFSPLGTISLHDMEGENIILYNVAITRSFHYYLSFCAVGLSLHILSFSLLSKSIQRPLFPVTCMTLYTCACQSSLLTGFYKHQYCKISIKSWKLKTEMINQFFRQDLWKHLIGRSQRPHTTLLWA